MTWISTLSAPLDPGPGFKIPLEQKVMLDDLYARYAECISDQRLEEWPQFFTEDCIYRLTPRLNYDRGLPISIILSESRRGLIDRVAAIRHTMVFGPRNVLLCFNTIRAVALRDRTLDVRTVFTVYTTLVDGSTALQMAGRSFDRIDTSDADWTFTTRIVVSDTELFPTTVIYPA